MNNQELANQVNKQINAANVEIDKLLKFVPIKFNLDDFQAQVKKQIEDASKISELNIVDVLKETKQNVDKGFENLSNGFKSFFVGLSDVSKKLNVPENRLIKIDSLREQAVNQIKTAAELVSTSIDVVMKNALKQDN